MAGNIVFICTGNICRSPMAECLFRTAWDGREGMDVGSAGVMAGYGSPASRFAVQAMDEMGLDLSAHRSQPVTPQMAATADLLVVMTQRHAMHLTGLYPASAERVRLLMSFVTDAREQDVMDPIGLSLDVYRYVRDEIAGAVQGLVRVLQDGRVLEKQVS